MNHEGHEVHKELLECEEWIINRVIGAAIRVHAELGPGLLESVYEHALLIELELARLYARNQVPIPVAYRGRDLGVGFRADIIVSNSLLVELKAVDDLAPIHLAQVITYLKLLSFKRGLLINFNRPLLKGGIRRIAI